MSTPPSKWTRRDWIRASLIAGAAAGAGAVVAATAYSQLFPPTSRSEGELRQSFVYLSFPEDVWWNRFAGQDVRVTDFQDWQGALAVWNGRFKDGNWVSGTGYPALVIRLKRDDRYFQAPTDVPLPAGYSLAFDDPSRDLRIVAIFNRLTHLCCYPDWHVPHAIAPARDYIAPCPTYEVFGQDPIFDVCHGGQWDPLILEWAVNPQSGTRYVGARMVHGPGFGPLPALFVRAEQDVLYGPHEESRQRPEPGTVHHARAHVPRPALRIHGPFEDERIPLSAVADVEDGILAKHLIRRAGSDVIASGSDRVRNVPIRVAAKMGRSVEDRNDAQIPGGIIEGQGVPGRKRHIGRRLEIPVVPFQTDDEGRIAGPRHPIAVLESTVPHGQGALPVLEIRYADVLPREAIPPYVLGE